MPSVSTASEIRRRVDAAMGRIPCDLLIRDVRFLDVFACEWRTGDISVIDGVIVGIEPGLKARRTIEGKGRWLVPGFIDAHVHVESSMMVPPAFEKAVLAKGTTTAICDPHELANVLGVEGLQYFLQSAERLALDLRVMLSSCVPATHMETNGGGILSVSELLPLASHPKALGLAEMMNVPGVLHGDANVVDKLEAFSNRIIDGHCPLVSGQALSAYAAAGISSCHESTRLDEAREKLGKGIKVWIREGSVAKDLEALSPLLTIATSPCIGFCTDDRNPLDIALEGHLDHLVRGAIRRGVPAEVAYRAAAWAPALHYGLRDKGAIAPGYAADLVLLDDADTCALSQVFRAGVLVGEIPDPKKLDWKFGNSMRADLPDEAALSGVKGRVHVIGVEEGKILTGRSVEAHDAPGVAKLTVLERYGRHSKPSNGYARGFGEHFHGAIASSVGHDSHNLICVGNTERDMRTALASLAECGGGFCVVKDGAVVSRLPLPIGGLMTSEGISKIETTLKDLRAASRSVGCALPEPFLQLAFLSLPVIPSLKLTDKGLVDVDKFQIIPVSAA